MALPTLVRRLLGFLKERNHDGQARQVELAALGTHAGALALWPDRFRPWAADSSVTCQCTAVAHFRKLVADSLLNPNT